MSGAEQSLFCSLIGNSIRFSIKIRVSKGLKFPCRPILPILHYNIYQRCAASPQDIVAQS